MALSLFKKASTTTTTTTTTTSFLRHLLHHKPLPTITPRLLCSSSSSDEDNEETMKVHPPTVPTLTFRGPPRVFPFEHPLQVKGRKKAMEVDETKGGMLVRVTLPGVKEKGCEIFKKKGIIYVVAEAEKRIEPEPEPRRYGFTLEFNPELHDAEKACCKIKNGILSLMVPKVGAKMEEEEDERKVVPYVVEEKEEEEKGKVEGNGVKMFCMFLDD